LALFAQDTKVEKAVIGRKDAGETITAALDAIQDYNGGWYALVTTFTTDEDILEVAGWTESSPNEKYYSFQYGSDNAFQPYAVPVASGFTPTTLNGEYVKCEAEGIVDDAGKFQTSEIAALYKLEYDVGGTPTYSIIYAKKDSGPTEYQWKIGYTEEDPDGWAVDQLVAIDFFNVQLLGSAGASLEDVSVIKNGLPSVPEIAGEIAYEENLLALIGALNYDRSLPNFTLEGHLDAGIVGLMSPIVPGAATAKFKTVKGVPVSALTRQQYAALDALNCNYFTNVTGTDLYAEGTVSSGEFLDVIIGIDWIKYTVSFNVFSVLARAPKIPYTDKGASIIQSEVSAVLNQAIERGILREDPAPVVTVPAVADVAASDRQARHLPDVRFTGELAGAIHKTTINGSVSV